MSTDGITSAAQQQPTEDPAAAMKNLTDFTPDRVAIALGVIEAPPEIDLTDETPGHGAEQGSGDTDGRLPAAIWDDPTYADYHFAAIKAAADGRRLDPTALLHLVLCRVAAFIPPTVKSGPGGGVDASSLNYFVAISAPPGGGKSKAYGVAEMLIPSGRYFTTAKRRTDVIDGGRPQSGPGLQAMFERDDDAEDAPQGAKARVPHVMCWLDEGMEFLGISDRRNDTTTGTLCTAWTGGTISGHRANRKDCRTVEAGTYSLGFAMGIQPDLAGPLFGMDESGLLQRFVWVRPDPPVAGDFDPDGWRSQIGVEPLDWKRPDDRVGLLGRPDEANAEIWAWGENVAPDEWPSPRLDKHDVHASWLVNKTATLLAVLRGETNEVNTTDWELAKLLVRTSGMARKHVQAQLRLKFERAEQLRLATLGEEERVKVAALDELGPNGSWPTARLGLWLKARLLDVGSMTSAEIGREMSSRDRGHRDAVLSAGLAEGWLKEVPTTRGRRFTLSADALD